MLQQTLSASTRRQNSHLFISQNESETQHRGCGDHHQKKAHPTAWMNDTKLSSCSSISFGGDILYLHCRNKPMYVISLI